MSKLIIIPQLRIEMRYQDWWSWAIPKGLETYFDKVVCLDLGWPASKAKDSFSLSKEAIEFEFEQVKEFMNIYRQGDTVLVCDLSFPGFFHNILHHVHCNRAYCLCHATSINKYDYFQDVCRSKSIVELGHASLYQKIFVATEYHKAKLESACGYKNIVVTGLPKYPFTTNYDIVYKDIDVISAARKSVQKVDIEMEEKVEQALDLKIERPPSASWFSTWGEYFRWISQAKVMIITSREETFGYQVLDAVYNNCIPIAPKKLSYPELLPEEYLYSSIEGLISKISLALNGKLKVPKLLNQDMIDNFHHKIAKEMDYEYNGAGY